MPDPMKISDQYLLTTLENLLAIPSPTGWTETAIDFVAEELEKLGLEPNRTKKGSLKAMWHGASSEAPRALTAHVDTLGAVVKEIKSNGRLKLSRLGGFAWNTIEGEGCHVLTAGGERIAGSILICKASAHVFGNDVGEEERSDSSMEVRLDIRTSSKDETQEAGVRVGDFVSLDPRTVSSENGFIRSRHLDDKAGVACLLAAVQSMGSAKQPPAQDTLLHISNYEEVGHGAAGAFPEGLHDLVAVDMAVVGEGQESDEFHTTICTKDTRGPYHHALSGELIKLAQEHHIPHKVDVYPYYGSDGEAYWRAGGEARVGLIGPGVDASHNYERAHRDGLIATAQLIAAYALS